jgi:hypothetical protein
MSVGLWNAIRFVYDVSISTAVTDLKTEISANLCNLRI